MHMRDVEYKPFGLYHFENRIKLFCHESINKRKTRFQGVLASDTSHLLFRTVTVVHTIANSYRSVIMLQWNSWQYCPQSGIAQEGFQRIPFVCRCLVTRGLIVRHSSNTHLFKLNYSKYWSDLLVPKQLSYLRRRMSEAITLLPLYAFMTWTGSTWLFLCFP
jgi:hypothetical protein